MVVHSITVQHTEDRTDRLFHALADRTRRDIIRRTMSSDQSVSTLAAAYEMSFAAVQKHVAVLERAGLVTKHRHGRRQLVRTELTAIHRAQALLDQIEQLWRDRIDRFTSVLTDQPVDPSPQQGGTA